MWFEMSSFPAFRQGYSFLQGCVVNKYTKSLKAILSLMLTQKLRPGFPTISYWSVKRAWGMWRHQQKAKSNMPLTFHLWFQKKSQDHPNIISSNQDNQARKWHYGTN